MENAAALDVYPETGITRPARTVTRPARGEVIRLFRRLDPSDPRSVLQYGRRAQVRLTGLVDEVMSGIGAW